MALLFSLKLGLVIPLFFFFFLKMTLSSQDPLWFNILLEYFVQFSKNFVDIDLGSVNFLK